MFSFPIQLAERRVRSLSHDISSSFPFLLWREASCPVLLIWGVSMESAVPSILTMQAWWWRWELDLSLSADSSLSASPFCLMFIHRALWKIQPEFLETGGSLVILSPVVFQVEYRWTYPMPFRSVLSFLSKSKASGKNKMCFALWWKGDKISALHINCCLEPV